MSHATWDNENGKHHFLIPRPRSLLTIDQISAGQVSKVVILNLSRCMRQWEEYKLACLVFKDLFLKDFKTNLIDDASSKWWYRNASLNPYSPQCVSICKQLQNFSSRISFPFPGAILHLTTQATIGKIIHKLLVSTKEFFKSCDAESDGRPCHFTMLKKQVLGTRACPSKQNKRMCGLTC